MAYQKRERNNGNGTKGVSTPAIGGDLPRLKFVDGYLTDDDKKWLEDNYKEAHTLLADFLSGLEGYGGLSCKYEDRSGKYLACLFGGQEPGTNTGYALTHRGSTPFVALYVLAYKHFIKHEQRWGSATDAPSSRWD